MRHPRMTAPSRPGLATGPMLRRHINEPQPRTTEIVLLRRTTQPRQRYTRCSRGCAWRLTTRYSTCFFRVVGKTSLVASQTFGNP
ncbi:hypothetical protein [Vreelandella populi]|uniref:Uncharacterized protein n=1 Tax=Vreelandella populi TaxID=2498858 RepID=A0A433LBG2_9GAMM|nr:hypothetical protein [Halomonas populi]RUR46009.1 hypothetical protein ELY37_08395 [Halomonas populi]